MCQMYVIVLMDIYEMYVGNVFFQKIARKTVFVIRVKERMRFHCIVIKFIVIAIIRHANVSTQRIGDAIEMEDVIDRITYVMDIVNVCAVGIDIEHVFHHLQLQYANVEVDMTEMYAVDVFQSTKSMMICLVHAQIHVEQI